MRTVHCRRYQEDLEGLDRPPLPGAKGQDIFESVSQKAWGDWQALQTMLINEKHLNMMDLDARKYLAEQMDLFLSGGEHDHAEGYVPPSQTSE
jgi:Fe-S cluster biosynthesis and repair protein YggX